MARRSTHAAAPVRRTRRRDLVHLTAIAAVLILLVSAEDQRSAANIKHVPRHVARDVLAQDQLGDVPSRGTINRPVSVLAGKARAPAIRSSRSKLAVSNRGASGFLYLGAAGDSVGLSRSVGVSLSDHAYAHFNGGVPAGRMITVEAGGTWRSVATAGPGSATYNDIVRWANTIRTRPGPVLFAYHHEPEASFDTGLGASTDFINAWRRVVTIFRAQGVHNVIYTWQMTAWSFRTSPSDRQYAAKWYPGDDYVDDVGADAYNWASCGQGRGVWQSFSALADPVVAFARAHHKQAAFPEFASQAGSSRAQWVRDALGYLETHRGSVRSAFYFQRPPTTAGGADCHWPLVTAGEFSAFGALARNRTYFSP